MWPRGGARAARARPLGRRESDEPRAFRRGALNCAQRRRRRLGVAQRREGHDRVDRPPHDCAPPRRGGGRSVQIGVGTAGGGGGGGDRGGGDAGRSPGRGGRPATRLRAPAGGGGRGGADGRGEGGGGGGGGEWGGCGGGGRVCWGEWGGGGMERGGVQGVLHLTRAYRRA